MKLATFVLTSIPILIQFYARKYLEEDRASTLEELKNDISLPRIKSYDFIVAGAGTAGCVVASRLSERFSVLLLENGGEPVPASEVPYFVFPVALDIETNYQFESVPQKYVSLDNNGIIVTHTGKMLGGSGSHNDMIHNRGSPHDFDNYAKIVNDSSWNYEGVLEHFKKYENFIGQLFTGDYEANYGHSGPITIDTDVPLFLPKWFEVGRELGFPIADPNGYQIESFAPMAKAIEKGQRSSSYNRHIKPFKDTRANLTVLPYSMVQQILIDENKKAYGVAYERHGIPQIAYATKEVILSAGTFSSPLLLMKSGIGPRDVLEAAEIPVKHELPEVGQDLNDHLMVNLFYITYNSSVLPFIPRLPEEANFEKLLQKYQETGEGILGHLQEGPQAFVVSSRAKSEGESDWPDILVTFDAMGGTVSESEQPLSSVYLWNVRPKSRGTLSLNTTAYQSGAKDDMSLALIDFKIFEGDSASDEDVLLDAIDFALRILNTTAMQSIGAKYSDTPLPSCSSHEFMSKDYWRCYIARTTQTTFHMVGTCSLGKVVDSKFRVAGIANLRVADASVFPTVPNANINAAVLMVGEKAADDILKTWM